MVEVADRLDGGIDLPVDPNKHFPDVGGDLHVDRWKAWHATLVRSAATEIHPAIRYSGL